MNRIFEIFESKYKEVAVESFREDIKTYESFVVDEMKKNIDGVVMNPLDPYGNLKKLNSVKEEMIDKGGDILDIFDDAERRAREGDEEDEQMKFEDEWYDEHDEDEEVDWSEFEYEENEENLINLLQLYMSDMAAQHGEKIKNRVESFLSDTNRKATSAQEFIDLIYREINSLSEQYSDIIDDRIKREKIYYGQYIKNQRVAFLDVFGNIKDLAQEWIK